MSQSDEEFRVRYGSFIIRVRQEAPGALRGEVEHVQSGAKSFFTSLTDIQNFIESCLEPVDDPRFISQNEEIKEV
jgi:hypothetical protein